MKKYLPLFIIFFVSALNAQNYAPDPTFGQNGTVVTNYNMYYDNDQAPKNVVFIDNKYVFAQKTQLSCFTENGSVEYNFGTMGYSLIVVPQCPTCLVEIKDIKIINNDIFVFGKAGDYASTQFYGFIAKLNADGVFDTSFGNNGISTINIGNQALNYYLDGISDLVYKDGKYFAIGSIVYTDTVVRKNLFAVKMDQNGVPDVSFGPSGIKKFTSIDGHNARNIFEYEDDLLIVGNLAPNNTTSEHSATFMKIDEDGNMLSTFGDNGVKKIVLVDGLCSCGESMIKCVLADNMLYFIRTRGQSFGGYYKIQKLDISTLQNVNPVASVAITDIAYIDYPTDYIIEGNKAYILSCPMISQFNECPENFTISRRLTDGTIDTSFNQTGEYSFNFPGPFSGASTYEIASTFVKTGDKILIGGYTSTPMYNTAPYKGFAMLKITDETLADDDFELKDKLSVYPNPTKNIINLSNPDGLIIDKVTIADTTGKMVYCPENSEDINIADLSTGIYFMKVYSQNKVGCFKIIKTD
jgi:hypothetical protein